LDQNIQKEGMTNIGKKTTLASVKTFANYVEENGPEEQTHKSDLIYLNQKKNSVSYYESQP
jgi:hypothetical protein